MHWVELDLASHTRSVRSMQIKKSAKGRNRPHRPHRPDLHYNPRNPGAISAIKRRVGRTMLRWGAAYSPPVSVEKSVARTLRTVGTQKFPGPFRFER
jgi:hypothetical protein